MRPGAGGAAATLPGAGRAVAVRALAPHEWPLYRALRLRALAQAPEAFASTLAEEEARGDHDWAWRLALGATSGRELPLVAEAGGAGAGLAWAKADAADPSLARLYQLWVAPEARGHGVGAALLAAALDWARARNALAMELGVVCGNDAARRLYARAGFREAGEPQPQRPGANRMEQPMRLALA
ncbi:GNAT family N-acetyltransferase [Massilia jejuensis]|uniref:GNAT family N-acetyltransferase n=1 Tax=Massilia jejuensis TaxID=648894 RepID=A0ABW0PHX2_9BURK